MSENEQAKQDDESSKTEPQEGFGDLGFIDAGMDEAAGAAESGANALVTDIHKKRNATDAKRAELRAAFPNILQRARAMAREVPPDFREVKMANSGGQVVAQPLNTDTNIMDVFKVLFGETDEGRPHFDTFRGLTVGWTGNVIDDDFNLMPLVEALVAFRIPAPSYDRVEKLFKRYARQVRINSLIERLQEKVPEWDGVPRIEEQLIKLYECHDTPLTRKFGMYFWLSIYNRAMYPGCNAPMVLAIFGTQGAGKSYLGKLICEEMMGTPDADSVPLDWTRDFNAFLRQITGHSVVANVAEMAGFNRADLNKIKNLTTRTVDMMDYKFERDHQQLRQWVMIMDGNEYQGLQRDETGNRRYYPIFAGQLPFDGRGRVQWREDFRVDFSTFRAEFWQMMGECRAWMEQHGMNVYNRLVMELERSVKAFSEEEMRMDRGTVRDDDLDAFILPALKICAVSVIEPHKYRESDGAGNRGRPSDKTGIVISVADIRIALGNASGRSIRVIPSHLKSKLTSMGGEVTQVGNQRVYLWKGIHTLKEWDAKLAELDGTGAKRLREAPSRDGGDGGF